MVNSQEFAKRLQKILEYYSISATAFSDEIEVNRSTISHLLSGRNKPSLDFVLKVIQHYPEVELYWLLNGKGSFPAVKSSSEEIKETSSESSLHEPTVISSAENSAKDPISTFQDPDIDRIVIFYKDGSFKSYKN
ncbi:MAG: helix-turn-helix domain-containing protein [Bacteroidia bacterium]|nr:helix-turn-helix domain-containing protein [Bacteroidia bacterium]NNF29747.1 helix-turn-helix transcriptional regulator [Flavobacteriaceae bacterium]NNJ81600.1 helix-turn-helix transcriptional regulator [Flavobacteriaceae bacterium]NNK55021.1 helix-turn-helix transcriptional regulator [Flavobacteriaceae bacterium]NNM09228.1 helix-turn-helix transcriptional regulator [Flavobacteriaceae bacterium]